MWADAIIGTPSRRAALTPDDAEGELGGHVDHVRAEAGQVIHDLALAREGPLHVRVQEASERRASDGPRAGRLTGRHRVGGGVDPHGMPARLERVGQAKRVTPTPLTIGQ